MQMSLETVRQFCIERNPWAKAAGIEVLEVGPARARLCLPPSKIIENPMGAYHAGALYTFAETAAACLTVVAFDMSKGVSVLMKSGQIDYGKVVKEELIVDETVPANLIAEVNEQVASVGKYNFPLTVVMRNQKGDEMCRASFVVHMRLLTGAPKTALA